jgi:hypothetical protein
LYESQKKRFQFRNAFLQSPNLLKIEDFKTIMEKGLGKSGRKQNSKRKRKKL